MTAQANADAASALVSALASRVQHAVVSPGSRNTPIVLALDAHPRITTHVVLDERVAGFVALGLARATGQPVILSCTSGSAGAHYLPALIEAYEGSTPLIAITADRPPELHGHAAPQTTHQNDFFGRHVVDQEVLPLPDETRPEIFSALGRDALEVVLRSSRPVHLNAPFREPLWAPEVHYPVTEAAHEAAPTPAAIDASAVAAHLRVARGLIIAGARDRQDRLQSEPAIARACHSLGRTLGWPVIADVTSGVRYHEGPSPVTGYDSLLRSERFAADHVPECALVLGRPCTSKVLNQWLVHNRVPAVVVGENPSHRDPNLNVIGELEGPLEQCLHALNETVAPATRDDEWQRAWARAEECYRHTNERDDRWWEGALARTLIGQLPAGALVHLSSSMPIRDVDAFAGPLNRAVTLTSNRGVNGIDGVVATALGQALRWNHGPALALVGDLAFLHDIGAVRLAASLDVALTVVVVNNGGGRIFDFLPIHSHPSAFDRYFLTNQDAALGPIVQGFGGHWERASGRVEFVDALERCVERGRFSVLEAVFDGDQNRAAHERFHQAVVEGLQ